MASRRLLADEVVSTDAERACLESLREATGERDGPLERHCLRVLVIAGRVAEGAGRELDPEVVRCAAWLHDIGIYPSASRGGVYVTDARRHAEDLLRPRGWPEERLRGCLDAIELHHETRTLWHLGAEVEAVRRADLIDVTAGVVAFGVPRSWLRGLFTAVPRDGFYTELGRLIAQMALERPRTMPRILRPRSGISAA